MKNVTCTQHFSLFKHSYYYRLTSYVPFSYKEALKETENPKLVSNRWRGHSLTAGQSFYIFIESVLNILKWLYSVYLGRVSRTSQIYRVELFLI